VKAFIAFEASPSHLREELTAGLHGDRFDWRACKQWPDDFRIFGPSRCVLAFCQLVGSYLEDHHLGLDRGDHAVQRIEVERIFSLMECVESTNHVNAPGLRPGLCLRTEPNSSSQPSEDQDT
jgi:hypothetical protein